jgi:hypothetical protein
MFKSPSPLILMGSSTGPVLGVLPIVTSLSLIRATYLRRSYLLCPLHAAPPSQQVGSTGVWAPPVVRGALHTAGIGDPFSYLRAPIVIYVASRIYYVSLCD